MVKERKNKQMHENARPKATRLRWEKPQGNPGELEAENQREQIEIAHCFHRPPFYPTQSEQLTDRRTKAAIARGFHLFPFRTEKLNPAAPMVLRKWESR